MRLRTCVIAICAALLSVSAPAQTTFSNYGVSAMTSTGVTISFTTSVPGAAKVAYGLNPPLPNVTSPDSGGTSHHIALKNISPGVIVKYQAIAADGSTAAIQSFQLCDTNPSQLSLQGTINNYYMYGTWQATFVDVNNVGGTPTLCGAPATTTYSGSLDYLGSFSVNVADTQKVVPSPALWQVNTADLGNLTPLTTTTVVTGGSASVSAALQSAAVGQLQFVWYNPVTQTFFPPISGGGGGIQFNVPTQFSSIAPAIAAGVTGGNVPVTIAPYYVPPAGDSFTNSTALRVFDYRQNHGLDSGVWRSPKEWGAMLDAVQLSCVFTASSTTLTCSGANFQSNDVGKTIIAYGAGPTGTSAVSTYTAGYAYVSGGTAPAGYPSGTWPQYVEALNGGTAGAACTTPPAGEITVNNGVPSGWVTLFWSGDGCVTPPTTWQISGFSGTSTFSGGTLSTQTMITTISQVISPTQVIMANAATSSSLSYPNPPSQVVYCTDDTVAWNAMAQAFAAHQFNAPIRFTGGTCISDTVKFENASGELSGSGAGNPEIGFQSGLGSYFFWASNTPGGVMLENAGGTGMYFHDFTLIGNSSAPPVGIELSGLATSTEQLGAANAIDGVNFGVDRGVDPNLLSYTGYWPILTGILANAPIGNVDFQRLCKEKPCNFFDVKYPVDKTNNQATSWEWGTMRVFYARVGFCAVGENNIEQFEGARDQTDVQLGSCQFGISAPNSVNGSATFHSISSDGDPQFLDMTQGEGFIHIAGGAYGFGAVKNSGIIIDGRSPANNGSLVMDKLFKIGSGTGQFSGFPVPQVLANQPSNISYGEFASVDPSWFPLTNFPVVGTCCQYIGAPPLVFNDITPDGQNFHLSIFSTGTDYIDVAQHHYGTDTAGLTQAYGTSYVRKLQSSNSSVVQISGATPGSTSYSYATQCRLNNWGTNTGSVGSALFPSQNTLTTGSATLTSVNANGIFITTYSLGCDGYYVYLFTGGAYKCLAKSGACVEFTTRTAAGYIAVDDGSYTYLNTPDADGTGVQNVDNAYQIGGINLAQLKSQATSARGSQFLADFSYKKAVDGQMPVFDAASNQYIPGTIVPQAAGIVASVGGTSYTSGYTTIGSLTTAATANSTISFFRFTPTSPSVLSDCKVYIGATATGTAYCAIYDSDGKDSLGNPNAPGTLLCADSTGTAVTPANAWLAITSLSPSACPAFTTSHNYFVGITFTAGASIKYDAPGFTGTSYFSSTTGTATGFPSFLTPSGTTENVNSISIYVDLNTIYILKAIPPVTLTTTAATSDNVTITGMTSSGHCSLGATNATAAANIATTYISAKTSNQITVTHVATSGMTYDILCTPN